VQDLHAFAGHEGFRRAVGAINGCHIRIVRPAESQKKSYINRKLFLSIIMQSVCDAKRTFFFMCVTVYVLINLVFRFFVMFQVLFHVFRFHVFLPCFFPVT